MNPPELETDSQNSFGTKVGDALRIDLYAKVWSEPMVKIAEGIWHIGPRRENMKAAGRARSAPRLLGKASSRQSGVEAAPRGGRTFRQNRQQDGFDLGTYEVCANMNLPILSIAS
jgi:hypothetical protein